MGVILLFTLNKMNILFLVIAFIVPCIIGYLVIHLLDENKMLHSIAKWVMSYIFGMWIVSFIIFVLWFLHITLSLPNIYIVLLLIIAALIFLIHKKYHTWNVFYGSWSGVVIPQERSRITLIVWLVFCVICMIKVSSAFVFTLQSPTYVDDSLDKRNMRAKVFYYEKSLVLDKSKSNYLWMISWPYNFEQEKKIPLRAYPPFNSILKFRIASHLLEFNDEIVNIINPLSYLFFWLEIVVLLSYIMWLRYAFIGGIIYYTIPYLWIHASNPYVELFVSGDYLITSLLLYLSITYDDSKGHLYNMLFWIMLGLLILTKKEALVLSGGTLWLMYMIYIFGKYGYTNKNNILRSFSMFFKYTWPALTIGLIRLGFIFYTWYGGVFLNHHSDASQNYFHEEVPSMFYQVIFEQANYNLIGIVWIMIILFYGKYIIKNPIKYLYMAFGLSFLLMFYSMTSTGAAVEAIQQVGINRALIEILPQLAIISYIVFINNSRDILDNFFNSFIENRIWK